MLQRALVAYSVAGLLLLAAPGMLAQLPDAPSAVRAQQRARAATAADWAEERAAFRSDLEQRWVGPWFPAAHANRKEPEAGGPSSTSEPEEAAMRTGDAGEGQVPFFSPRERAEPVFSSSTSYLRQVPGDAPALHATCPRNSCPTFPPDFCCGQATAPFAQYLTWPDVVPLTARDNLRSAVNGVIDPFNLLTIGGDAAIGIASDSHTPYGPGMHGFFKYAGVSLTEDMAGEFFGTYLVPSLMHQDPHYHREPFMPIKHRILHAIVQIVWTQSYTGKPMFNYANFVGGAATAAVSNTFVPGPNRQGFGETAQRLALAFAISPSGNLIEEFVPDLASHINLRVVIFQRILNSVTLEESGVTP